MICQEVVGGELSSVDRSGSAADRLVNRARDALARTDGVVWRDKDRVVRAFTIAATTVGI